MTRVARGLPAFWSSVLASPFVGGGVYVYLEDPSEYVSPQFGLPMVGFGLFVILVGLYIQFVAAPGKPTMREGEEVIDTRHPALRAALAKAIIGFGFLLVAAYLLFFTFYPFVYPIAVFVVGMYLLSTGLHTYWTNTLTTYYVTNRRLIKEYRFISLVRQEIPFSQVRGVEERRSVWEALVGLGNVSVSTGGGRSLKIVIRNIPTPTAFADEIRNLV